MACGSSAHISILVKFGWFFGVFFANVVGLHCQKSALLVDLMICPYADGQEMLQLTY